MRAQNILHIIIGPLGFCVETSRFNHEDTKSTKIQINTTTFFAFLCVFSANFAFYLFPLLYKSLKSLIILIMIGVALVACGTTGEGRRTLESRYSSMETRRAALYTTATIVIERQLVTVEYVNTQVARAAKQQDEMLSTLQSRGIDISILPQAATLPSIPTEEATIAPIFGELTSPPVTQAAVAPQVTPFTITPVRASPINIATAQETVAESAPLMLRNITMALDIDSNDCALNITNRFNTETGKIYIVARATDIQAGMVITSRWIRDDLELTVFNFTPGFSIEDACIWFFADQTDFDFIPGSYSIILEVNGIQASQPITFTIVDAG